MSESTPVRVEYQGEDGPVSLSLSIKPVNLPAFEKKLWELAEQFGPGQQHQQEQ